MIKTINIQTNGKKHNFISSLKANNVSFYSTEIGEFIINYKNNYIDSTKFIDNNKIKNKLDELDKSSNISKYFNGTAKGLISKYKLNGTNFQVKVWNEIIKIPYGETKTYGDIAVAIGQPTAHRAVANACGKNKIALFVPCHRVVGKNNIGGYEWGVWRKQWLLDLEKKNS